MNKDKILELYYQGYSDTKIGKILNIDKSKIGLLRKELSLPRMSMVQYYKNDIIDLVNKNYSDIRIAETLNISKSMVGYIRKRLKIPTNFVERIYKTPEDRIKGYMIRQVKYSAKRRKLDFNLSYEDISLPKYCPFLEEELIYDTKHCYNPFYPSIDRIDNNIGYVKGNVMVISRLANAMKNESSLSQLHTFCKNANIFINNYKNRDARGNITDIFPNYKELSLDY